MSHLPIYEEFDESVIIEHGNIRLKMQRETNACDGCFGDFRAAAAGPCFELPAGCSAGYIWVKEQP